MKGILVVALLLCPAAQAFELQAAAPPVLLPGEPVDVAVVATLECVDLPAAGPAMELVLSADASHPGLVATPVDPVSIDWTPCAAGSAHVEVQVDMTLEGDTTVPGEQPIDVRFNATVGALEASTAVQVEMAYAGGFEATASATRLMAAPQKEMRFLVELVNNANARTKIDFATQAPGQGNLVPPAPIVLAPAGEENSRATVVVRYATPFENGFVETTEPLYLSVSGASADRGTAAGEPIQLEFEAETKGWYIPGPGMVLLPALLGAAGARRLAVRR